MEKIFEVPREKGETVAEGKYPDHVAIVLQPNRGKYRTIDALGPDAAVLEMFLPRSGVRQWSMTAWNNVVRAVREYSSKKPVEVKKAMEAGAAERAEREAEDILPETVLLAETDLPRKEVAGAGDPEEALEALATAESHEEGDRPRRW